MIILIVTVDIGFEVYVLCVAIVCKFLALS